MTIPFCSVDRNSQIIRTSWVGIAANVLLAFYYSEGDGMLSVDVVPDFSVHDDEALIGRLSKEIQPLVPGMQVVIVVDHNYS